MKRPRYRSMRQSKKAGIVEAFKAGDTIGDIARRSDLSQSAIITILEDEGCENVRPLGLRRFSWQDEEDARA